jgi:hypothetical protein
MPFTERESTAKALLARGTRILKRQGSKLNLLPSQVDDRFNDFAGSRVGEAGAMSNLQRQPTLTSRSKYHPACGGYPTDILQGQAQNPAFLARLLFSI